MRNLVLDNYNIITTHHKRHIKKLGELLVADTIAQSNEIEEENAQILAKI